MCKYIQLVGSSGSFSLELSVRENCVDAIIWCQIIEQFPRAMKIQRVVVIFH